MIITKTPFRISIFGGGTDISEWFLDEGGAVLSTTIDKYCYVNARVLPPFFSHSIRLAYSKIETVSEIDSIEHPLIREALRLYQRKDLEIHYDADLPSRSGLGSSSSFAVGLLSALEALHGRVASKKQLADSAIRLEREILKEHGGIQDQIAAAFGGLNHIQFFQDGNYSVTPISLSKEKLDRFRQSMLLCYIPIDRFSSDVSLARNFDKGKNKESLEFIKDSVPRAIELMQQVNISEFGNLLHETWMRKRGFSGVSNSSIDQIYTLARSSGAIGGKLLGAGGGGFMLLVIDSDREIELKNALSPLLFVPFEFELNGTQIIHYQN